MSKSEIKERPNITIKNCGRFNERQNAIYAVEHFMVHYKMNDWMNDCAYEYDGFHYHVKPTGAGNIIVELLRNCE